MIQKSYETIFCLYVFAVSFPHPSPQWILNPLSNFNQFKKMERNLKDARFFQWSFTLYSLETMCGSWSHLFALQRQNDRFSGSHERATGQWECGTSKWPGDTCCWSIQPFRLCLSCYCCVDVLSCWIPQKRSQVWRNINAVCVQEDQDAE